MSEQGELYCPNCQSNQVLVYESTAFWANTGEFYCHTVKSGDSFAEVRCDSCGWLGFRDELEGLND